MTTMTITLDTDSRIFLLIIERRNSYLKHSRLSVVAFLNELPVTKHDLSSFTVDVSLALVSHCQNPMIDC